MSSNAQAAENGGAGREEAGNQRSLLTFDGRNGGQDRPAVRLQPGLRRRRAESWS